MPNRTGPSVPGARSARELYLRIARVCERAVAEKGEIDPAEIAELLEAALRDPCLHPGILLGIAEIVGMAAMGSALDPACWSPLKYFTGAEQANNIHIPLPAKRF